MMESTTFTAQYHAFLGSYSYDWLIKGEALHHKQFALDYPIELVP